MAPLTEKHNVFNPAHHGSAEQSGSKSATASEDEVHDEKPGKGPTYVGEMEELEVDEEPVVDPFVPFDDLPDEKHWIVTARAMLVGCVCGALVNASNLYLGLKTGWTFGASLFGSIVGFSVLVSSVGAVKLNLSLTNRRNHSPRLCLRASQSWEAVSDLEKTTSCRPRQQHPVVSRLCSSLVSRPCISWSCSTHRRKTFGGWCLSR